MGKLKETDLAPKSPDTTPRRPYVRPELRELGAVEELTRGGSPGAPDNAPFNGTMT